MSNDPIADLLAVRPNHVAALPQVLASWWIQTFAERFVRDQSAMWWWASLKVDVEGHDYGDGNGLLKVKELADGWGPCVLIVTDEEPNPLGCLLGFADAVTAAMREVRHFEFILGSISLDRWLFDTHHNSLLIFEP